MSRDLIVRSGISPVAATAIMGLFASGLVATGTNQATALVLTSDKNVFATVAVGTGAILQSSLQPGDAIEVQNNGANTLALYPPVGSQIGTNGVNVALMIPAGSGARVMCSDTSSNYQGTNSIISQFTATFLNNNAVNTVGAATLTGAQLVAGVITRGGAQAGAAFTDTTDTAANIIAAIPDAVVGQSQLVYILNTTNAQQTIAGGVGVTATGVLQNGQNCEGVYLMRVTGAATVSLYGLGSVDRGADNFNLTADPGTAQDNTQGYGVGSIVFNTTAGQLRWWECRDASTGAAKWVFSGADYANGGTNPPSEVTEFGAGTATCAAEGNINRQVPGVTSGVSPGATGADNVIAVYSLPASSFDASGRGVTVTAAGNFAANGNSKRCKLIFNPATAVVGSTVGAGGTTISDTGTVAQNGGAWVLMGSLFKRGAGASNTQVAIPGGVILSGSHVGATAAVQEVTATESGIILIAVTGNAPTATGDIILSFFEVNAMN